jgi:hypothetical protein
MARAKGKMSEGSIVECAQDNKGEREGGGNKSAEIEGNYHLLVEGRDVS